MRFSLPLLLSALLVLVAIWPHESLFPQTEAFSSVTGSSRKTQPSVRGVDIFQLAVGKSPLETTTTTRNRRNESPATPPVVVTQQKQQSFYVDFAQRYPFANNLLIATTKTAAADLLAQTVISGTPITEIDLQRSLLFCLFGAIYLGGFQYLYQVQIFKRLFDVDRFTQQPWKDKLRDTEGLQALAAQTVLDLTVLTIIYLPTFYIFKASVFSGSYDPAVWVSAGLDSYQTNFAKDEVDLIKVWLPADLVCFSVPLYLRLPVRHVVSFVWTAYLSFARGGH